MTSAVALGSARTILHAIEHLVVAVVIVVVVVVVAAVVAVVAVVVVVVVVADAEAIKVFHFPLKDHF